jgi:hypothetical protein
MWMIHHSKRLSEVREGNQTLGVIVFEPFTNFYYAKRDREIVGINKTRWGAAELLRHH